MNFVSNFGTLLIMSDVHSSRESWGFKWPAPSAYSGTVMFVETDVNSDILAPFCLRCTAVWNMNFRSMSAGKTPCSSARHGSLQSSQTWSPARSHLWAGQKLLSRYWSLGSWFSFWVIHSLLCRILGAAKYQGSLTSKYQGSRGPVE